jgi:hypothetical protein
VQRQEDHHCRKAVHCHIDKDVNSGIKAEDRGDNHQAPGVQASDVVSEIKQKLPGASVEV